MIHHYVTFLLEGFESTKEAQGHLLQIKKDLEALPFTIPALKYMRVHLNTNPQEGVGFMLEAHLEDWEQLSLYAQHPHHVRIVKELIAPYKKSRLCVDTIVD